MTLILKKIAKITLYVVVTILVLLAISIKPIEHNAFREQDYYLKTMDTITQIFKNKKSSSSTENIKVGWGKANITPDFEVPMVGYGIRPAFTDVIDSLFVKTIVFKNNETTVALINFEFMLITSDLTLAIEEKFKKSGVKLDGIYYSLTHTHNSYGGFTKGAAGKLILGGYQEKVADFITQKTLISVQKALQNLENASFSYQAKQTENLVVNKLDSAAYKDELLRSLKIKTNSGRRALLSIFSAHTTTLSSQLHTLTGDFPSLYNQRIEKETEIDFSVYSAGAVGGLAPDFKDTITDPNDPSERFTYIYTKDIGNRLYQHAKQIKHSNFREINNIEFKKIPVFMPKSQFRISKHWQLRNWLFEAVFGKLNAHISYLKIGNNLFLGMPCDFGGELCSEFEYLAQKKNINLIITSFNGDYTSYMMPSKYYYTSTKSEVNEMNWFGRYSGDYFVDVINKILKEL